MLKYNLFDDFLSQTHLLIAGTTGSGKSVVVNGMLYNALFRPPHENQFILIDPKRVELIQYAALPHTIRYASEPSEMIDALQLAMNITENRYRNMQRRGLRKYDGSNVYVIIDELADLMTTNRKAVQPLLQRLCQIGRAANMHVVACTQCPLVTVIPTAIKVNFDARVGLRTRNRQDSRNILDCTGLETLPQYGECYYLKPGTFQRYRVPMYSEAEMQAMIAVWNTRPKKKSLFQRIFG